MSNPLLTLPYESALENLGEDYYDAVEPAKFPQHVLRFRNDDVIRQIGLSPEAVSDRNIIQAFGRFEDRTPFLALRYHGYQFRNYNPFLGDGRGFLYGQVRATNGKLYDFGTKGSGTTPYSRGGDGRLTLKGGLREVLASEALHALGVNTSRTLSLIETGEALQRGDEPSPTRSSVMVRFSHSHIRFGTFERLKYIKRPDLAKKLLDHVLEIYYPHITLKDEQDRYAQFFTELSERLATLVAQWMSVGFCHAVLNTDNMSITGESFDYGPYAFLDQYNPKFTAAYFDYSGLYRYSNQPGACYWNLEKLAVALDGVVDLGNMEAGLTQFQPTYAQVYCDRLLKKLGFSLELAAKLPEGLPQNLIARTLTLLEENHVGYHNFFYRLSQQFTPNWQTGLENILLTINQHSNASSNELLDQWRQLYHQALIQLPADKMPEVKNCLENANPKTVLLRSNIEAVWNPIAEEDFWRPFYQLLEKVQHPMVSNRH